MIDVTEWGIKRRSRTAIRAASVVAGLLALASVAWACTAVMNGTLTLCTTATGSCVDDSSVTSSDPTRVVAAGLPASGPYNIIVGISSVATRCHPERSGTSVTPKAGDWVVVGSGVANASGNFGPVPVRIPPPKNVLGPVTYHICAVDPLLVNGGPATHKAFSMLLVSI